MKRFARFMDSLLVSLGSKPARIVSVDDVVEPVMDSKDSVAGSSAKDRDFFASEISAFGGGKVFDKYMRGKEADGDGNG
ncbi:hypothetical protein [Glutamicibacter ardleyensis]|uniref:hypothetical protein n=1 Tax=Glutamicibacter ardleyensis TaxID=225894 RepID=UPI003FD2EBF1